MSIGSILKPKRKQVEVEEVRRVCKKCAFYKRPKCLKKDNYVARFDPACYYFEVKYK